MPKVVLFNIAGDCLGITLGLVRLIVKVHIIGTKPVQGHMRSPKIVPDFKLVAQLGQMINAFDKGDSF